ncbi:hypothetical protein P7H19_15965 [Paenibacillus larvae]|nr:hypothetical protein [Paenibacillus larvae]MDT2237466.1 hypothetical protein [Paenibacillus larvae]
MLDKIEDNQSAIRAIQAGKMIEVRLNPGVPFQGIGLKKHDRIKYDVLELRETGKDLHEQFERIITVIGEETQMEIKFKTLTLHNFKSHRDLTVEFGDLTKITGENTKGKSFYFRSNPLVIV